MLLGMKRDDAWNSFLSTVKKGKDVMKRTLVLLVQQGIFC